MAKKRAMMIGLDGADPLVVRHLMDSGEMPNLKAFIERGTTTEKLDMIGVFPSVTPPNWASLATGNYPKNHGITDFMNHTLGKPLDIMESNWDSRRVESELIWETFEAEGRKAIEVNYVEAWPPRVPGTKNIFIDGTGAIPFLRAYCDFQKIVTMEEGDFKLKEIPHFKDSSSADCVVYGDQLDEFYRPDPSMAEKQMGGELLFMDTPLEIPATVAVAVGAGDIANGGHADLVTTPLKDATAAGWTGLPEGAKICQIPMNRGLVRRYAVVLKNEDGIYDTIGFCKSKKDPEILVTAKVDTWSDWIYDTFVLENDVEARVCYKIRGMELAADGAQGKFYLSHVLNLDDFSHYYPQDLGLELQKEVGPLLCFANCAPYDPMGRKIVMETFEEIYDWQWRVTEYLLDKVEPDWDLYYTHLHAIDLVNHWYLSRSVEGWDENWEEYRETLHHIYRIMDVYIGKAMKYLDDDTMIIVTSDHAAIPNNPNLPNPGFGEMMINNFPMVDLGFMELDNSTIPAKVVWEKTKAVAVRSSYVYINLKGREPHGIVEPEDYEKTVQEVITGLYNYKHPETGERVISFCMTRSEMEMVGMGGDHVGDILYQMVPGYNSEVHTNQPSTCEYAGYSMGNLFAMAGGGIRQNFVLDRTVRVVDIVPTICEYCGVRQPKDVEGGVIYQAFEKNRANESK